MSINTAAATDSVSIATTTTTIKFNPSYLTTASNLFDMSNFSLVYGIIALALFILVLVCCTFSILCYFRCISKATLQQQQLQRHLALRRRENQQQQQQQVDESNTGFQMSTRQGDTLADGSSNKPPVYDNILNYSIEDKDKLPTYNSYKQSKERFVSSVLQTQETPATTNSIQENPV